ncbi:MAG: hypothetical protein QMC85_06490 [Methanocellales archaeon]|nr:hypothetical protein [Methanocellales archaeon]
MRIPLVVKSEVGGLKPFVRMSIRVHERRIGVISAFIDTGSPWSVISKKDIETIQRFSRISLYTLARGRRTRQIPLGGAIFEGLPIEKDTSLVMKDDSDQLVSINPQSLYALQPSKDKRSTKYASSIPSIIGVDFLEDSRFALYFDPYNKRAFLEKV